MTTVTDLLHEEEIHEQQDLVRGLKDRHVQLIAIGGAIGVGLFLGSATAISRAGPGLEIIVEHAWPRPCPRDRQSPDGYGPHGELAGRGREHGEL